MGPVAHRFSDLDPPPDIERMGTLDRARDADLLAESSIVAAPTQELAYPTGQSVALEAAAAGCAVVVTGTPAMRDYSTDAVIAAMPPPHDVDSPRAALRSLAADADLTARLASAGQDHVMGHHSQEAMWDSFAQQVHKVLGASTSGGRT